MVLTAFRFTVFSTCLLLLPAAGVAATVTAASCSRADVGTAVTAASNGDTVTVPPGSCTWTSTLDLGTKAITLQGAGIGQTNLTNGISGSMVPLIRFTEHSTVTTRITGFTFSGGTYDHRAVRCDGTYTSAPFRLDHSNLYTTTSGSVHIYVMNCKGLVDHNTITAPGNSEMLQNGGNFETSWTEDVTPGSADALYVEDNVFTNNSTQNASSAITDWVGARIVARHNTFYDTQIDAHGTAGQVGTRWYEFYENTFTITQVPPYTDKAFDIRGGSGVIFNNHHAGDASYGAAIVIREEDSGYPASYQPGRGINNNLSPIYVWGNDSVMSTVSGSSNVVLNRDYYVSSTQPAGMKRWQLAADNANTTYSYVPYTYPHPLQGGGRGESTLLPPTGLSVTAR